MSRPTSPRAEHRGRSRHAVCHRCRPDSHAPPALRKRETVALSNARYQYQLEVLADEATGNRPLGRLSGAIIPVADGFRVCIEGFRSDDGALPTGAESTACSATAATARRPRREEAGRLYRLVREDRQAAGSARELDRRPAGAAPAQIAGDLPAVPSLHPKHGPILRIAVANLQTGIGTTRGYWHYLTTAWKYRLAHDSRPIEQAARFLREADIDIAALCEIEGGSRRTRGSRSAATCCAGTPASPSAPSTRRR